MYSIENLADIMIFTTDNNYFGDSFIDPKEIFKVANTDISLGYFGKAPVEVFRTFNSVNKLHTKRIINNHKIYSIIYSNTTPIWCYSEIHTDERIIKDYNDFSFKDYEWCKENNPERYWIALKDYIFFDINEDQYFYYLLQNGESIFREKD